MPELIRLKNLKKYFPTRHGVVHAVDDISFSIEKGETMGIVGESGCGKSTLGRILVHLEESTGGNFFLNGRDSTVLRGRQMRDYREKVQIIFQDPYSSLNPRYTVEEIIMEPLKVSGRYTRAESHIKTEALMDLVGIAKRLRLSYPHELDGGRRQRVGIARALALEPEFVVCDEPVSALDVSIQAQILNLLKQLQIEKKLTYMFITHDMSVVRHISANICVMYLGQLVEQSPAKELFVMPCHPYTKALLSAIPSINIHKKTERILLRDEITSPIDPEPGCRFVARCNYASGACREPQKSEEVRPGHYVSCCKVKEINQLEGCLHEKKRP
jgi:peptide/nickel transport system ATP-binding protein